MRHAIRPIVLTTALIVLFVASTGVARADDLAWKAAHDTDPHLPLTVLQVEMTAEKRAAEPQNGAALLARSLALLMPCDDCGGGGDYPPSASLVANQTPQNTSYYCGPASVHEALGALGISLTQSAAANALNTTTNGTAWSGGGTSPSGYPVPDVLNAHETRNYYVPQYVASATSNAIQTYEDDLKMDIYALEVPLIGDAWEVPGHPHLVGHPVNQQIFHWFEIRGYQNYGGSTMYEDSVHGAGSIPWSGNVPAYSTMSSSTIVGIVAGRGYVW